MRPGAFRRYGTTLLKEVGRILDIDQLLKEWWEDLPDLLTEPAGANRTPRHKSSPKQVLALDLLRGYTEIHSTYDHLLDLQVYVGRAPYRGSAIPPARYLTLLMEDHLHEAYILRERLLSYLKRIRRRLVKAGLKTDGFDRVEQIVRGLLFNLVKARGSHVHELRHRDEKLEQLRMLEMLVSVVRSGRSYYRAAISENRKRLRSTFRENNREIKKLLDFFFGSIHPYVFGPKVRLLYGRFDGRD